MLGVLAAAALAVLALATRAPEPAPARGDVAEWHDMANDIAEPWQGLQKSNGQLRDYMDERFGSRYGDSVMGYALIQTGLREGDDAAVETGMRAITFAVGKFREKPSSFEHFAIAAAYNLARRRLDDDDYFREVRPKWERWMRKAVPTELLGEQGYGNHWLADGLSVLEMQRTGLRSSRPDAILGGARAASAEAARRLFNVRVPKQLGDQQAAILSDSPDHPITYHGFTAGLYARAVRLLGNDASPRARDALRRIVRGSQLSTAPDGDTTYFGRSHGLVWGPAGTAYGAEVAASLPETPAGERRTNRALAARTLEAVRRDYPVGPRGQWIVPAMARDFEAEKALEDYVGAANMSGLALMLVEWALDEAGRDRPAGRLPADRDFAAVLSQEGAQFAVVRRDDTWFAVKMAHATRDYLRNDLRYDFGLLTAKRRDGREWSDLVPQRPHVEGAAPRSSGPVLTSGGVEAFPGGASIVTDAQGRVTIAGSFATRDGVPLRPATFTYTPVSCGVQMAFFSAAGDGYEYEAYFRATRPIVSGSAVTDGEQTVSVTPRPTGVSIVKRPIPSARDPQLYKARIRVETPVAREVRMRFCDADAPGSGAASWSFVPSH